MPHSRTLVAVGVYDSVPPGPIAIGYRARLSPLHPSQSTPGIHSTVAPVSQPFSAPFARAWASAGPSVLHTNFLTSLVVMTGSNFWHGHSIRAVKHANLPVAFRVSWMGVLLSDVWLRAPCPHLQIRRSRLLSCFCSILFFTSSMENPNDVVMVLV